MDLFKKIKGEIKEMMGDDKKDNKDNKDHSQPPNNQGYAHEATRDYSHNQQQPYQQQPDYYSQPHQQSQHIPPQHYGPPPSGQSLPPGWVQQWDVNSQRYYYIDPATGRSQWDPPNSQQQAYHGAVPPHDYGASQQNRGWSDHGAPHPSMYPAQAEKKKSSGKGGLVAAGVGGAAIGALGAAALSGDSSDDEHPAPAQGGYYSSGTGDYYSSAPPPGAVPLEDNPDLSSSQRSSLEEAREDLQEAEAEVAGDSSASSSDLEELQEAREEYASEAESAEEELED